MAIQDQGELELMNENGTRNGEDRRQDESSKPVFERRKVQRRRQIDPTTCERDYSNDEIEFMQALDQYKRDSGRMFPTCSEILEVIRGLGYCKTEWIEESIEICDEQGECDSDCPSDDDCDSNKEQDARGSAEIEDSIDLLGDFPE